MIIGSLFHQFQHSRTLFHQLLIVVLLTHRTAYGCAMTTPAVLPGFSTGPVTTAPPTTTSTSTMTSTSTSTSSSTSTTTTPSGCSFQNFNAVAAVSGDPNACSNSTATCTLQQGSHSSLINCNPSKVMVGDQCVNLGSNSALLECTDGLLNVTMWNSTGQTVEVGNVSTIQCANCEDTCDISLYGEDEDFVDPSIVFAFSQFCTGNIFLDDVNDYFTRICTIPSGFSITLDGALCDDKIYLTNARNGETSESSGEPVTITCVNGVNRVNRSFDDGDTTPSDTVTGICCGDCD